MSIYATLGVFGIERDDNTESEVWITVQGVPSHIGSPTPGNGYEAGDPYAAFLPPAVTTSQHGDAPHMRAAVFVLDDTAKGTDRSGQEYVDPLLVLTGEEFSQIGFVDLMDRLNKELDRREGANG